MAINLEIGEMVIPRELDERSVHFPLLVGISLVVSFVIMALARYFKPGIYSVLGLSVVKVKGVRSFVKDNLPQNKPGSVLLLVNYLIAGTALMMLYVFSGQSVAIQDEWVLLTLPAGLLILNLLSFELSARITGEAEPFAQAKTFKMLGAEISGIVYFVVATIWALNIELGPLMWQIALWVFISESVVRIVKSGIAVLSLGVDWYYIILYLCTLEILPLFVVYYLLVIKSFA